MLGTIKTDRPLKVMSENWGPLLTKDKIANNNDHFSKEDSNKFSMI
ncbi:hypothetical protein VCHE40_3228 [Vibrio cholerae HE-40]|nr:hypothetical protein VCHE40_3228 [Vibrio cholerae HE-40]